MKKITFLLFSILFPLFIFSQCLIDKDAGTDPADLANLANDYNNPSPYAYGGMLGVNDAGQFQGLGQVQNPIRFLTTKMRAFRAMDYDFNQNLQYGTPYASLIKPKDVNGTPQYLGIGNSNYDNFYYHQGITSISSATEILNKDPLTWKEKIWNESDWWPAGSGLSIPQQIEQSYGNYTTTFLNRYGDPNDAIVKYYQVGNELWDYPFEEDYHAMLKGAHTAFTTKYGNNSATWPVKFMPGSFQAFTKDNVCGSHLRDFSNCGSSIDMYNQIGDYLNISDCQVLQDMHAINIHSYPFEEGTLDYVHPEKQHNEFLGFIASLAFRDANPILQNKGIWLTETGYDSWNIDNGSGGAVGVGAMTQAAYLLRMYMITSRYHLERVDFYMAFDLNRTDNYWHGNLYSSSGLWELGLHPVWNSGSADPAHGAKPKPAFFALYDFQTKFETKVFYKAAAETNDVYAYIIAEPDGSDPYLVFWNPTPSDDGNVFGPVSVNQTVTLPSGYAVSSNSATYFATTGDEVNEPYTPTTGNSFNAVTGNSPGATTITAAARMPAYIALTQSAPCTGATISTSPNTVTATITAGNVDYINVLNGNTVVGTICSSTTTPCSNGSTNSATVTPGSYTIEIGYSDGTNCQSTVVVPGGCTVDADNDGVCASVDCDDNDNSIPTAPGTACDDNDPNTSNDEIQADGCTCAGSSGCDTQYTDCAGGVVTATSNSIAVDVNAADVDYVKVMLPDYTLVDWLCAAWLSTTCTNGLNNAIPATAGTYIVQFKYADGTLCEITNVTVGGSSACGDPDLTVVATLIPANIQGISTVSTVIRVSEVGGYDTEGSTITVRIPADERFAFIWDPFLTQIGFNTVNNSLWNYTGSNLIFHNFEFSGVLGAGQNLQFGYIGAYDPQNTNGQTTISATVVPFSGGETNPANNADSELLIYFQ